MTQKFTLCWPKLGVGYFPKREFFGKVDQHCFGLTNVSHDAMSFQKNCHTVESRS